MNYQENSPKSILILNKIKAQSVMWEKDYDPNGEMKIISIEEQSSLPYRFEGNLKIGQIYIKHPFIDDLYLKPDLEPSDFQILKLNYLSQLCAILGAKYFRTTLINRKEAIKEVLPRI